MAENEMPGLMHIRYRNINKSFTELTFQYIPSTGYFIQEAVRPRQALEGSQDRWLSAHDSPGFHLLTLRNPLEQKSPQSVKNESLCSFTGPHRAEYCNTLSSHMVLFLDRRPDRDPARARRRGHLVLVQHILNTGMQTRQANFTWAAHINQFHLFPILKFCPGSRRRRHGSPRRPCLRLEGRDRRGVS